MASSRPIIVGGGIGGLTLALALSARGIPSLILEQATAPEPVGAGIQLSPNAGRILDDLGLARRLDAVATRPACIRMADGRTGRHIADIPLGAEVERRYGDPYRVLHRADLHEVLLEAVRARAEIELRFAARVGALRTDDRSASVEGPSGLAEHGGLVVGADGIGSVVARHAGLPPPTASGLTAWRALVPVPAAAPTAPTRVWLSNDTHLVAYPVAAGTMLNLVLIIADTADGLPGGPSAIGAEGWESRWAAEPLALLRASGEWRPWPLLRRMPAGRLDGPITLLGDAAHPVLPFLAQGAALAIEDAAVLATEMFRWPTDPQNAARSYELARRERWRRVQAAAASAGRMYHLSAAPAAIRNAALRLIPASRRLEPYAWIFGWRPPDEPMTAGYPGPALGGTTK